MCIYNIRDVRGPLGCAPTLGLAIEFAYVACSLVSRRVEVVDSLTQKLVAVAEYGKHNNADCVLLTVNGGHEVRDIYSSKVM